MDRSLRPFSLAALSLALVLWAGLEALPSAGFRLEALGPAHDPVGLDDAEERPLRQIDFAITGDVLGSPDGWPDDTRVTVAAGRDGKPGYRLDGMGKDSVAYRLGLKNGDLVFAERVDPRATFAGAMWAAEIRRDADSWCTLLERDGEPLRFCYRWTRTGTSERAIVRASAHPPDPVSPGELADRIRTRQLEREERQRARAGDP